MILPPFNPEIDLKIERMLDATPEQVWKAWTQPELLKQWFCPRPWSTVECEIDLRPGGAFNTTMQSPEGKQFPNKGCYLEVVPNKILAWTDALQAGYRPADRGYLTDEGAFYITAVTTLEAMGNKTKYTACAFHRDAGSRKKHEEMGFYDGWGTVITQLEELCKKM